MTEDNYVPFGYEWEKELSKLPKKFLIGMIKAANIERQEKEAPTDVEGLAKEVLDKHCHHWNCPYHKANLSGW